MTRKITNGAINLLILLCTIFFLTLELYIYNIINPLFITSFVIISTIFVIIYVKNYLENSILKYNIINFICCLLNILLIYLLFTLSCKYSFLNLL